MNKEQIYKHSDVIKWFCDNPDSMVWYQQRISKNWVLTDAPAFGAHTSYVQNDEYAELRKAQANGKTIEVLCSGVFQTSGCLFNRLPEDYRIKPDESKLKVGDWVRDNVNKSCPIFQMDELPIKHKVDDFDTRFELWKPVQSEFCVLKDSDETYRIERWKNYFYPIAIWVRPLEFIQTLKS